MWGRSCDFTGDFLGLDNGVELIENRVGDTWRAGEAAFFSMCDADDGDIGVLAETLDEACAAGLIVCGMEHGVDGGEECHDWIVGEDQAK